MANVRTSLRECSTPQEIDAGATVSAFVPDVSGNPTATLATLYAAATGSETLANPQTLDGQGKWKQPVYHDQPIVLRISSAFAPAYNTGVIRPSISDADVTAAQNAATIATAAAMTATQQAAEALEAAQSANAFWPLYWRHDYLFTARY